MLFQQGLVECLYHWHFDSCQLVYPEIRQQLGSYDVRVVLIGGVRYLGSHVGQPLVCILLEGHLFSLEAVTPLELGLVVQSEFLCFLLLLLLTCSLIDLMGEDFGQSLTGLVEPEEYVNAVDDLTIFFTFLLSDAICKTPFRKH